MVTRRRFLGMLAALPALTVLAGSGIRLPRKEEVEVDFNAYFASPNAWYIKTDHPQGLKYFHREARHAEDFWDFSTERPFTEESLQALLKQMPDRAYRVQPTKLIIQPHLAERAEYILTHRPGLVQRVWWWLNPEPA